MQSHALDMPTMVALFALVLALVTQAAAAPLPQAGDAESTTTTAAEQVTRAAQQLRGDATMAAALAKLVLMVPSRHLPSTASRQRSTCGCWPVALRQLS